MSIRTMIRQMTVTVNEEKQAQTFSLEYYVLERETVVDGVEVNTFGIEVLKRSHPEEKLLRVEYRKIFDIFCTKGEAIEAVTVLAENAVTPVSVCDVIEQFVGTDEFLCEEYQILAV